MLSLTPDTRVHAVGDHLFGEPADGGVILDMAQGRYYGLNEAATTIWRLLQEPRTVQELRVELVRNYAVEPAECEQELLVFLTQLLDRGLVQVDNASVAAGSSAS